MMIRINESHKTEVLNALREEGLRNLLLEMWLEDFPLDIYAQLYQLGEKGYMLNVPSIATVFSYPDTYSLTDEDKLQIIGSSAPVLMGPRNVMHELSELFPERLVKDTNMMGIVLHERTKKQYSVIQLKTEEHFEDLLSLYLRVPEFRESFLEYTPQSYAEEHLQARETDQIVTGIYRDGKLVSASTWHDYEIENVCTDPEYRRKGLSGNCLEELLSLIPTTSEGKRLILFTENPDAMRLYEELGFEYLGAFSRIH